MLGVLRHWTGDEATRRKILADNPAQLYGGATPASQKTKGM